MKELTVDRSFPCPKDNQLDEFERKFGITLPNDYRLFLKTQNPYSAEQGVFPIPGTSEHCIILQWFPFIIDIDNFEDEFVPPLQLSAEDDDEFFEDYPKTYLVFGDDPHGLLFVLGVKYGHGDFGKVFLHFNEDTPPESLTFLADSFEDFISGLFD